MRNLTSLVLLSILGLTAEPATTCLHTWKKVEIVLTAEKTCANPYFDVDVWVDLTAKRSLGRRRRSRATRTAADSLAPRRMAARCNTRTARYRLQRGAIACIEKGTVVAGITDGHSGSKPDIGAYEYGLPNGGWKFYPPGASGKIGAPEGRQNANHTTGDGGRHHESIARSSINDRYRSPLFMPGAASWQTW